MVDWSQYGLEDYAEGFDKLGIRSLDELIEMAPTLEDKYGLDGLCDLLGVERKKKETPARVTKTGKSKPSKSDRALDRIGRFLNRALLITVVILILLCVVMALGPKLGIFKSELTVILSTSQGEQINLPDARLVMIDAAGEHQIRSEKFGSDGAATLKVPMGEYDTYVTCDGWSFYYGRYSSDGTTKNAITLEPDDIMLRVAVLEFFDEKGNPLVPETVSVTREGSAEPESCSWFEENRFVLLLPNEIAEETLQISADEYEIATVEYDWSSGRYFRLEVVLKNA